MIRRYLEYREMQQLRKDHLMKQNMRYLLILMGILGAVLAVTYAVEAVTPKTSPAVTPVPTFSDISVADQQEIQDIEEFASIVTKPVDSLSESDFDLMSDKAEDPCYEKNVMLPQEQMIKAITTCKSLK